MDVLEKHDSGQLRNCMNDANTQFAHGRRMRDDGETQYIGGSIGGGPRRIIDEWEPPNWRQFPPAPLDFKQLD